MCALESNTAYSFRIERLSFSTSLFFLYDNPPIPLSEMTKVELNFVATAS